MKTYAYLLLFLFLGLSVAETPKNESRPFWSPVGDFFKGIWNRASSQPASLNATTAALRPNTTLEDTIGLVSEQQWYDIGKTRNDLSQGLTKTLALSEIVERVRATLGSSVSNITDQQLTDVLFTVELVDKLSVLQDATNAVKLATANVALFPKLMRNLGNGLTRLLG